MSDVGLPTVEKLPECHNQTAWIFTQSCRVRTITRTIVANCEQPSSPSSWKAQLLHHMQIYNRSREAECLYIQSVVTQIKESNLTYFSEVCQLHLRWWLLCAAMGNFCWSSMLANFARVKNHCKILSVICQQQLGILSNYNQVLGTTILETLGICYADTSETSFTAKWRYPKKTQPNPKGRGIFGDWVHARHHNHCFVSCWRTILTSVTHLEWAWTTSSMLRQHWNRQLSLKIWKDHEQKLEEVTKAAFQDLMCDAESDA